MEKWTTAVDVWDVSQTAAVDVWDVLRTAAVDVWDVSRTAAVDVWDVSRTADKERSFSFGIWRGGINCKEDLGIEMR